MSNKNDIKQLMDLKPAEQPSDARREIMTILLKGVRDIELQLSCKERLDMAGVKLSAKDYNLWRRKAIKAMNHMNDRYREYKALDKAEKEAVHATSHQAELITGLVRQYASEPIDCSPRAGSGEEIQVREARLAGSDAAPM
jgi:hypothetical protein